MIIVSSVSLLGGCNLSFHDIGIPPALSSVNSQVNSDDVLIPPEPVVIRGVERKSMLDNGLWNKRDGIYFRDTRAYEVGDILTVNILTNDSAKLKNRSDRDSSLNGSLTGSGTYTIPGGLSPTSTIASSLDGSLGAERGGSINRSENIRLNIAAIVVAASENGNLQISGTQEIRVNHELRILTVKGIVRSKDILPNNTIPYEKIAEARISYGGSNSRTKTRHSYLPSFLKGAQNPDRVYN